MKTGEEIIANLSSKGETLLQNVEISADRTRIVPKKNERMSQKGNGASDNA